MTTAQSANQLTLNLQQAVNNINSNLAIYNSETDALDIYVNGAVVGSIPCNFQTHYLYNEGVENTPWQTGGVFSSSYTLDSGFIENATNLQGNMPTSQNHIISHRTTNKQDLSKYTKIRVIATINNVDYDKTVDISNVSEGYIQLVNVCFNSGNHQYWVYVTADTTNFNDNQLAQELFVANVSTTYPIYVKKIWLE